MINCFVIIFIGFEFVNFFVLVLVLLMESKVKIFWVFEVGWGGVVIKIIGLYLVENVVGLKMIYQCVSEIKFYVLCYKWFDIVLYLFWNWELILDQLLDLWLFDFEEIKIIYFDCMVIVLIMVGVGSEVEMDNWCKFVKVVVNVGCDVIELNMFCLYMDCKDMGVYIVNDEIIICLILKVVIEVVSVLIWVKLMLLFLLLIDGVKVVYEVGVVLILFCNIFFLLLLMDFEILKFEVEVDGLVILGGFGGLVILYQVLQCVLDILWVFLDKVVLGIGGIRGFCEVFNFIVYGVGNLQVCIVVMEDKGSGGVGMNLI